MTDNQLIKQLKNLKELKPSKDWQLNSRQILLKQIENSGAIQTSAWQNFLINLKCVGNLAYRPVIGVASFLIVVIGLSFFAYQWFQSSKPNDSLYIARVISERARLNTVLDSNAREIMSAKFAMSHAQDISNLLADPDFDFSSNDQVDKLNENFNREITVAKERVVSWQEKQETEIKDESSPYSPSEEDDFIFIADNQKEEAGLQVLVNEEPDDSSTTTTNEEIIDEENDISQSELDNLEAQIIQVEKELDEEDVDPAKLLDEAKELFDQGLYQEASLKLSLVKEMMQ
jgi:hypothetical protein